MEIALWTIVAVLILIGVVGTALPAIPGALFVFAGIWLGAWIHDFTQVGLAWVVVAGVLTLLSFIVDLGCQLLFAQRAGASRPGLVGAALGLVAGIFAGFVGVLMFPLIGAAIGEWLHHRDCVRAGRVGVATWFGLLIGTILKLAIVFGMVGLFVVALII